MELDWFELHLKDNHGSREIDQFIAKSIEIIRKSDHYNKSLIGEFWERYKIVPVVVHPNYAVDYNDDGLYVQFLIVDRIDERSPIVGRRSAFIYSRKENLRLYHNFKKYMQCRYNIYYEVKFYNKPINALFEAKTYNLRLFL